MLVITLMVLLIFPGLLLASNSTEILPFCPGIISPVDQLGTVHPQPAVTFISLNGSSPVLVKMNSVL